MNNLHIVSSHQPQLGSLLRHWRQTRRKSQLALALDADVSARHVSFVESGRSKPSRDMVLTLAEALDVPFRERNALLLAAGYAPLYRETALSAAQMRQVREAVDAILEKHEPFPAVLMDRYWNLLSSNRAAERFFGLLLAPDDVDDESAATADNSNPRNTRAEGETPPEADTRTNVVRMMFDPAGLRPRVLDWEQVAASLLGRIRHEAVGGVLDDGLSDLIEDVLSFPDVPASVARPSVAETGLPIVPVGFEKAGQRFHFFSTVTTLGTPQDITSQEMRIECFFPADEETRERATALLGDVAEDH